MPFTPDGIWYPSISDAQLRIFNNYKRYTLLSGPRKSSKTIGGVHKILRHCWENDGAHVGIVTKTIKNAKAGGIWIDLTEIAAPEWIASPLKMKYTVQPKISGDTRMSFFKVSNQYGGQSTVELHSLDYCDDVEGKFKGTRFSMFYFSELSNFESKVVFDITTDQLRMPGIPYENHQWMGDTNPPEDGQDNWMYDLWFTQRSAENPPEVISAMGDEAIKNWKIFQGQLEMIELNLDDNPFLPAQERADLIVKYAHDIDKYNRFVLGKWERETADSLFRHTFLPAMHLVGGTPQDDDIIVPDETSRELICGFDLGHKNQAGHIIDKRIINGMNVYSAIDELVIIGKKIGLKELTERFLKKMEYWENEFVSATGRQPVWRFWSDTSSFDYKAAAESSEHMLLQKYSNGRIRMAPAPKPNVSKRVEILQLLFQENRCYISARMCPKLTDAVKYMREGRGSKLVEDSPMKHPFDSFTYALIAEEPQAIMRSLRPQSKPLGEIVALG